MDGLSGSGKALIVTLLFRLLFGGYVVGMDQYNSNDIESALMVLLIHVLLGISAALFLLGRRYGLIGVMGLSTIIIIGQSIFIIMSLGQTHAWSATFLYYLFNLLTLILSIRVYRET